MIHLELTEQDADILRQTIRHALGELSYEIANTDSQDFRDALKAKRDVLAKLEETLAAGAPGDAPQP